MLTKAMAHSAFTRRELLRLSTLAALGPLTGMAKGAQPESALSGSTKKGLGISPKRDGWDKRLADLRCKWFYTWTADMEAAVPQGMEYIPMVFGRWGIAEPAAKAAAFARKSGVREILGFNEPDAEKQGNLSVEKALDAWPLLMETGLRLGSPACVHPDNDWMKKFMAGVEERKLRIDFICMHSYAGPNAEAFVKRLESVHKLYGKPIWITEFAVGDWEAKSPETNRHRPETVLNFMQDLLPKLEEMNFVERYAWFPARQDDNALGTSALFDKENKLTPLGECYRHA